MPEPRPHVQRPLAELVSDTTAFFYLGELFSTPSNPCTEEYVTGKLS